MCKIHLESDFITLKSVEGLAAPYMYTHISACTHVPHIHLYTHTCTHTHTPTYTHTHRHTQAHTHTHRHTNTHTHTHTHTNTVSKLKFYLKSYH